MSFYGEVWGGTMKNWLDFGGFSIYLLVLVFKLTIFYDKLDQIYQV